MRIGSWTALGLSSVFIGIYEVVFISAIPFPLDAIRPALPLMVMLIALDRPIGAYFMAVVVGILFDLLSGSHFAALTLGFPLVVLFLDLVSEKIMTNRSLYATLLLMLAAQTFFYVYRVSAIVVFSWLGGHLFMFESISLIAVVYLFSLLQVGVWFLLVTFFTRRFMVRLSLPGQKYG